MTKEELDRQYSVIDQSISMHAYLRDKYARWAFTLNTILLVVSILLCAFVFADDFIASLFKLSQKYLKFLLGMVSIITLISSLIEYKVDWQGKKRLHQHACKELSLLKQKYRQISDMHNIQPYAINYLSDDYIKLMASIPPIAEKEFNRLKARHLYKVKLSQCISASPETPLILTKLKLRWQGIKNLSKKMDNETK